MDDVDDLNDDELAELLESGHRAGDAPGPGVADLRALLGDERVWAEPAPGGLDALMGAIRSESAGRPGESSGPPAAPPGVTPLDRPGPAPADPSEPEATTPTGPATTGPAAAGPAAAGPATTGPAAAEAGTGGAVQPPAHLADRRRRRGRRLVLAAAAALVVAAGVAGVLVRSGDDGEAREVALAGTELAPDAAGTAEVEETPSGVSIALDVEGLPPSEPGTYYQAWVKGDDDRLVTIGTFHVREGDDTIELWSGVSLEDYPLLTVTLQREGEGQASSGQVVLSGRIGP